jgi:hypothetical protein
MSTRLTITMTQEEREALARLAQADVRPVKEQLRYLLRSEAERRGLWPTAPARPAREGCAMQGLNVKPHGGNRGVSVGTTAAGGCASTVGKHTPTPTACLLRNGAGRVVATVDGDCLKKQVDGSKHFLQKPPGIAFDAAILEAAERAGVQLVRVRDRETGDVYACQLSEFALHAIRVDRGFGLQWCLPFAFWRVRRAGEPIQLGLFGAAGYD